MTKKVEISQMNFGQTVLGCSGVITAQWQPFLENEYEHEAEATSQVFLSL